MRKILVAVCDTEQAYGEKLGEWLSLEKGEELQSCYFSSPESFLEFQKTQKADVVLLGDGFPEELSKSGPQKALKEERQKVSGEVLESEKTMWLSLRDSKDAYSGTSLPVIEKYQSASGILRDIFYYYQESRERESPGTTGRGEMTGIYSPGHSIWQTPFALTLACLLGREEQVLYVNLKECAGFGGWLGEKYERDLMDVIYLCLTNEENTFDCIRSAVYTVEGVDYIPPMEDGACLSEISKLDYLRFLKLLEEKGGYDRVILDFGMMVPGFFEILNECSNVYIPVKPDEQQEYALRHFQEMLKRQNRGDLEGKISYLTLPHMTAGLCRREEKIQHWIWGELGDYTRKLMGVQGGAD